MSLHSYLRCWLHLIWGTLRREPLLPGAATAKVSGYLTDYAAGKDIYMKINYVNADHVHALIDLPTKHSIEEVAQLFKGSLRTRGEGTGLKPGVNEKGWCVCGGGTGLKLRGDERGWGVCGEGAGLRAGVKKRGELNFSKLHVCHRQA